MEFLRDLSLYRPSEVRLISVLVEYRSYLRDFLHEHFYFFIAIAIYVSSVWLIAWHYGVVNRIRIGVYSENFALISLIYIFLFFVGHAFYVMIFIRPDRLTRYILADLKENYLTPKRLLNAIPVIIIYQLFASAYSSLKALIPVINPYSWDDFFIKLDAFIHFGLQPWQLLHPFLGNPLITYIINFMYILMVFYCSIGSISTDI